MTQAGGVEPLVCLLRDNPEEISAELAAVALRNMALQNNLNRQAILAAGGLQPLLQLLSTGQERLVVPLQCEVCFMSPPLISDSTVGLVTSVFPDSSAMGNAITSVHAISAFNAPSTAFLKICAGLLQVVYNNTNGDASANQRRFVASQCCFDPRRAELCIGARVAESSMLGCFAKPGQGPEAQRRPP